MPPLSVDSHIHRIVLATKKNTVPQYVSHRPIKCQSRSWSQRGTKVNGSHCGDNPLLKPTGIQIMTLARSNQPRIQKTYRRKDHFLLRTTVSTVWKVANISESKLQSTEKTACCSSYPTKSSNMTHQTVLLVIEGCYEGKLCDILQEMASTNVETINIKPPHSISRATSTDLDCYCVPTASVLSSKANKSLSNQV